MSPCSTPTMLLQHQSSFSPSTPGGTTASFYFHNCVKKQRGSYNCGRCGLPKKGHLCKSVLPVFPPPSSTAFSRRALSFDSPDQKANLLELDPCGLPANCVWEVLRRLPPRGILIAGMVCKRWQDAARQVWRATDEMNLRIPPTVQTSSVGSLFKKCPGLVRLNLRIESDIDATMLAWIAFSCPMLKVMEIHPSRQAINRINGDDLVRFVSDKSHLTCIKMEGCANLRGFVLQSSSLSTLWLADLHSLSKMVFECPNLKELSLHFSPHENDTTDLIAMVDDLGRTCYNLQSLHVASTGLSDAVAFSLSAANLRGLRMLSLVLGTTITDKSVSAIASSYSNLELLDLSGSSISDIGIGMICNMFPETLSRLLVALCPNITASGIQFATTQLPLLEILDCGMTICDPNPQWSREDEERESNNSSSTKESHNIYQKLIVKHQRLKKLSLWGCSGLDALCLNCCALNDLNIISCKNLHPDRTMLMQCPSLSSVHASGCQKSLIVAIQSQVFNEFAVLEEDDHLLQKRLPDSSKRVLAPHFLNQQQQCDAKKRRTGVVGSCDVIVEEK